MSNLAQKLLNPAFWTNLANRVLQRPERLLKRNYFVSLITSLATFSLVQTSCVPWKYGMFSDVQQVTKKTPPYGRPPWARWCTPSPPPGRTPPSPPTKKHNQDGKVDSYCEVWIECTFAFIPAWDFRGAWPSWEGSKRSSSSLGFNNIKGKS